MAERVVRLTFPAKPDYLLLARLALSGIARELPVDEEVIADLKLAVTEACGNAVRHAYVDGDGPVRVRFVVADDRLEVFVEDDGIGVNELAPAIPEAFAPAEKPLESGMGMPIIRAVVDELDLGPGADGAGTVVRMVKRFDAVA
jgi:serine/threonine-protein kinase RsbW